MADVLKKRGHLDTDMHIGVLPNEDGVRNWYDIAKSQGKPPRKTTKENHQKQRERYRTNSPSQPSEGDNTSNVLILDFQSTKLRQYIFVLNYSVCGPKLRQHQKSNTVSM